MSYDKKREAAARRTKYQVGDQVTAVEGLPEKWRRGVHGVVEQVEKDKPGSISSTGILLHVRVGTRLHQACAYWWRKS